MPPRSKKDVSFDIGSQMDMVEALLSSASGVPDLTPQKSSIEEIQEEDTKVVSIPEGDEGEEYEEEDGDEEGDEDEEDDMFGDPYGQLNATLGEIFVTENGDTITDILAHIANSFDTHNKIIYKIAQHLEKKHR